MNVLIINGPNLNMLGQRETEQYGELTYSELCNQLQDCGRGLNLNLTIKQSNAEHELIQWIQEASDYDALIINPAAFTHTSIAIRDALACLDIPKIEVHLSNVYAREAFRHTSYSAASCIGQVAGFGIKSYFMALNYIGDKL